MIQVSDVDAFIDEAEQRKRALLSEIEICDAQIAAARQFRGVLAKGQHANSLEGPFAHLFPPSPRQHKPSPVINGADTNSNGDWPGLRPVIRRVSLGTEKFTLDNVLEFVGEHYPAQRKEIKRVAVSGELWRLCKNGEIKIVTPGKGRTPHVYTRDFRKGGDAEEDGSN
jgi:hypothetical protein